MLAMRQYVLAALALALPAGAADASAADAPDPLAILRKECVNCHTEAKRKGGLLIHTRASPSSRAATPMPRSFPAKPRKASSSRCFSPTRKCTCRPRANSIRDRSPPSSNGSTPVPPGTRSDGPAQPPRKDRSDPRNPAGNLRSHSRPRPFPRSQDPRRRPR